MKNLSMTLNGLRGEFLDQNGLESPKKFITPTDPEYKKVKEEGSIIYLQDGHYYYYENMDDSADRIAFYKMIHYVRSIRKCALLFTGIAVANILFSIITAILIVIAMK